MKNNARRTFIGITLLVIAVLVTVYLLTRRGSEEVRAVTNADRVAYLNSCGWIVNPESMEIREVLIPTDFNEEYKKYAELQASQGFDIEKYKGKTLVLCTYHVLNHPQRADHVIAELLLDGDRIVGGAIRCTEQDGFTEPL